jgi:hypothetical protein
MPGAGVTKKKVFKIMTRTPTESLCHTMGPPVYYWDGWRYGGRLENVPDREASTYDD